LTSDPAAASDNATPASRGSDRPPAANYELSDPDVRLMLLVRDGNAAAFEELVRRYQNRVLAVLRHLIPNRQNAEDLTQDVFLRVYRARENYVPNAKFSTWLFTITHNVAKNAVRQLSRRRECQSDSQNVRGRSAGFRLDELATAESGLQPARQLDRLEMGEVVRLALESLPERQRMALLLAKFEEMSYQEIADTMELTIQAVKSLLSRARGNLRDALQPYVEAGILPAAPAGSPADSADPT